MICTPFITFTLDYYQILAFKTVCILFELFFTPRENPNIMI